MTMAPLVAHAGSIAEMRTLLSLIAFHVAAPVVSFAAEANAVATCGWSVTVSGLGFGYGNATPTARLGVSSCATTAWVSASSATCMASAGEGQGRDVTATVSGVVGTQTSVFSYDGHRPDCGS